MHTIKYSLCLMIFVPLFFYFLLPTVSVFGQSKEELQGKIDTVQNDIAKIEAEILQYQKQLAVLATEKNTLAHSVKELDLTAKKLSADIRATTAKIQAALLKKEELQSSITSTGLNISGKQKIIASSLKDEYANEKESLVLLLLRTTSLGDMWREIEQERSIRAEIAELTISLQQEKDQLEEHKKEVEENEKILRGLEQELKDKKRVIDLNTTQKKTLLKETQNKESSYALLLKKRQAEKEAFENDLRSYESQLKFILDPKSIPRSGTQIFEWPVTPVYLTQLFGKTVAAKRLYASGSHSGIDFGIPVGTKVRAVLGGTVIGSGNTDAVCPGASYGNWIFIRHDNGLSTVYGHLSLVTAKTGSRVSTGEIIAYSGNTGYSTGPHLHLSVFASSGVSIKTFPSKSCGGKMYTIPTAATNAYLDPMLYLPPYKK